MPEIPAPVSYEDLAAIEDEFEEIDTEIIRHQYHISKPAYAKRAAAAAKIENFWPLVLEQAPGELDQYISADDSRIFAESLLSLDVTRPELDMPGSKSSPRSFTITFHFKPNEHFTDEVLEKHFWYRRAEDGWTGLVSEPVKIHWKGEDPTKGLTDGAVELWDQRRKSGGMKERRHHAYAELKKKVEQWNGRGTSFFTWFGWVSGRRWVSVEESELASKQKAEGGRSATAEMGEADEDDDEAEAKNANEDDSDVEVHEAGEDIAISLSDDIWPNAIKYFTQGQEMDGLSDVDFEVDDLDDEDDDDEPIDIRSLVQGRGKALRISDTGPPAKKQKK